MGNCVGFCELIANPDRLRGLHRIRTLLPENQPLTKQCNRQQKPHEHSDSRLEQPVQVLDELTEEVDLHYELCQELGRGQFGVIRLCKSKKTGEHFACKSISKGNLNSQKEVDAIRREIRVMKQLKGHSKIVEINAVFEDETWVHLVMELCEGGDLFERIAGQKSLSETQAAEICRSLMEAVQHWQSYGIIHRDIKPENILLVRKSYPSEIKVADFGLAANILPGEKISGMAGSAYYIAPEVLRGEYGMEADVWSSGVVVYILLCGLPPFWDKTEEGIFDAIKYGRLDLWSDPWPSISSAAKDLMRGMLCPVVKKRFTPEQVLRHEWIVNNTQPSKQSCSLQQHRLPSHTPCHPYPSSASSSCSFLSEEFSSFTSRTCMSLSSSSLNSSFTTDLNESQESPALPFKRCKMEEPEPCPSSFEGNLYLKTWIPFIELVDRIQLEFSGIILNPEQRCGMNLLPTVLSQLQSCTGVQCTIIETTSAKETAIINLRREKFFVVFDKEKQRFGWKHVKEKVLSIPLEQNKLLWSSCTPAVCAQAS